MKKKMKNALFKVFSSLIVSLFKELMDKAIDELNEEIQSKNQLDEKDRDVLKSGVDLLYAKLESKVRERF